MGNKKLVILGGGESGVGAAILGKDKDFDVFLSDRGQLKSIYIDKLVQNHIAFEQGGHDEERILNADLVIKSPGIPDNSDLIIKLRNRGVKIISEIEFAGWYTDAKMCCITGSNGKTTTTLLLYHLLKGAGLDVGLAGNVGFSLAEQVARSPHTHYVVELSSFQLDGMSDFKSDIAILTNITPDHLDRYDYQFENYIRSKFRILNNMDVDDLFIGNRDNEVTVQHLSSIAVSPQLTMISYNDPSCNGYLNEEKLFAKLNDRIYSLRRDVITIQGRHNMYNAMCVVLAAMKWGLSDEEITKGLTTFPQVEHRLEFIKETRGVRYINDSKATNVDSAWYALDSMPNSVIWIAGGTDKGNDYSLLTDLVRSKVKVLICMGVDNQKLLSNFSDICKIEDCHSLDEAMQMVTRYACEGDTVLLSPCCASFDLFKSYEDRGQQFKKAVNSL